ncbi:MAG TPA: type II secretion system F family protein [Solirubrobacteraceae bacterium]|nr:type II secretion system F family protein [Solirubrobacteraceae bacterium]
MTAPAAISGVGPALALFAAAAAVGLYGFWLLVSSAARRSVLIDRGGVELRRRPRFDQRLNTRLIRTTRGADLAAKLHSAGVERTAGQFLLSVVGAAVAAFVIIGALFPLLLAIVAAVVAVWGSFTWLNRRLEKRNEEFVGQLPEIARLLSNGASAGLSIPTAIELCVREIDSPAKDELQTVVDELMLGRSLDDSLGGLQRRLPSREISVLMTTLIIQQRSGGDAVTALQELSHTLDMRRETLREVRTLMAGALFTSYIVPVLGIGSLLLLDGINPDTLHGMTTKPLGIAALVVAAGLYSLGWVAIRRTTRIEL